MTLRGIGGPCVRKGTGLLCLLAVLWAGSVSCARAQDADPANQDFEEQRRALVESLSDERARRPPVEDSLVLAAMGRVPRHRFVPERFRGLAYADRPLPIGQDQTISQPYIVARMTELLELEPGDRVLEVGTGSGYQAAVLAEITREVYSVEILPELARAARGRLAELGYGSVEVRIGNGWFGWEERAPFDAIVVTAAPEEVPDPLVEQLAPGGRMVIPVGPQGGTQRLLLVEKADDGAVTRVPLDPVRFVPLVEEGGTGGGSASSGTGDPAAGTPADGPSAVPSARNGGGSERGSGEGREA